MIQKKKILGQAILLSALLIFLVASQAGAGWVITMESSWKARDELQEEEATVYLEKGLGFKSTTPDGNMMIMRIDTRETYIVDAEEQKYEVTSWDEMKEEMVGARAEMKKVLEEMEKEMADAPPEMREMLQRQMEQMQGMFGEAEEKQVRVERTGKTQKILGYKAEQYLLFEDDEQTEELWIGRSRKLRDLVEEWKDVTEPMFREMTETMPAMARHGYLKVMKEIEGFPLLTVIVEEGAPGLTSQVVDIEKRRLKEKDFLPPAGYTER